MPYWFEPQSVSLELGGKRLSIETGRMAKQAAGSAVVTYGDSVVLVTATTGTPREGIDFFPLTVDFVEKTSAAGKIPGGFFKREARLSDREILVCRFIDRSIRPLFAEGFRDEVQVTATVLAHDGKNPPDLAAFVGASAALSLSQIPFLGPIGAVRLGRIDGQFVVNPTHAQQAESDLELVVAGSRDALVMVEGAAKELAEAEILGALQFAHREIQPLIDAQLDLVGRVGKPKLTVAVPAEIDGLRQRVRAAAEARLRDAIGIRTKAERYTAIGAVEKEIVASFVDAYRQEPVPLGSLEAVEARQKGLRQLTVAVKGELHELRSELMRERILADGVRIDGRSSKDIRPIACEVRPLPRAHGVALFTRGETQALVYTTLGTSDDAQTVDALTRAARSTSCCTTTSRPSRSARPAAARLRPARDRPRQPRRARPRSGAAVARRLPLHDARGVRDPGVERLLLDGHGLRRDARADGRRRAAARAGGRHRDGPDQEQGRHAILSDILGDEDHLGDMDFKVAGTAKGITALPDGHQDPGVDCEIWRRRSSRRARAGCTSSTHGQGASAEPPPRELSPTRRASRDQDQPDKIRDVIGPGGKMIRASRTAGAKVDVEDDGIA
jgi:polyribonucleotide nucleotidyltransferase